MLLNMRTLRSDGSGSRSPDDGVPWSTRWPGPQEVIFGHNARLGLQQRAHATGLDTGCVYGKELTAYLLPERSIVSVPAERAYVVPATGSQTGGVSGHLQ